MERIMPCSGCGKETEDWVFVGRSPFYRQCVEMLSMQAKEDGDLEYATSLSEQLGGQ